MDNSQKATIDDIREAIDAADAILLKALSSRFRAVKFLRTLKHSEEIPIKDFAREKEMKALWKRQAKELDVPEELALLMLDFILAESKKVQGA